LATELIAALIGAVPVLLLPAEQAIAAAVFGWLLLPLIMLDYQHLWLPNRLVFLLAVMGVLVGPMLTPDIAWTGRATGMVAGFLSLEMVRQAYKLFRKHDGMGAGDPKLFGALGIWLGWQTLPMTLLIASAIGLTVVSTLHVIARHQRDELPFGSFLGVAAFVIVLLGF
jgi:leader peptidase (prepilin peptidase)/N-methyltransferase